MQRRNSCFLILMSTFAILAAATGSAWAEGEDNLRPLTDFHQHLFSPTAAKRSGITPVTAKDLVSLLDAAGIRRALVLSVAYQYSNPNKPPVANEYAAVKAENDWTSHEVAAFPDRLRGFCGINPLKDYAAAEIERCAKDPNLHFGLKLHFGNSDVDATNPEHVDSLRRVFALAKAHGMAVVVHLRPTINKQRPYGAQQSQIFLDRVLPAAPDVPIQIAHLAGAGGYDDPKIDEALMVFVRAISNHDPRMDKVYFDASGVAGLGAWRDRADLIAARIRQLGLGRVLYGSDGAVGENAPINAWSSFRQLPLTEAEFRAIAGNSAPYFR